MTIVNPLAAISSSSLLGILFYVAIAAVVIGAIVAIVRHLGINIPPIVVIVFWALLSIAMIVVLFRAFGVLT